MELNNTTDRYNYIYGNTVRKHERDYYSSQGTSPKKEKLAPKKKPIKQSARKSFARVQETFDWKYTVMIVSALIVLSLGAIGYVHAASQMTKLSQEVKTLTARKVELQAKQVAIRSEIDKSINLDNIREYAEKKLNMVYPDHNNVIYYKQESNDFFRQYESVDKK